MSRIAGLLLIKRGEGRRTAFFIAFFLVMGAGLAIGKGSADALFIKRFGVENFPYVYLVLSVVLAINCILYAAFVDRLASEKFFRVIFAIQLCVLCLCSLVINLYDNDLVYPVYYLVYAVSSEMLLLHGALYIGQNFHTRQAKRLTPLIFAGYQVGMMIGGIGLIFVVPWFGLGNAPLVWGALVVVAGVMLMLWHRRRASPYYFHARKSSRTRLASAVEQVSEGIEYTRRSSLLRNASYALFFMVITYYMLSYSVHTIYTGVFEDEEALAGFFGILVIVTNVIAMSMQLFVTNRIIGRYGIRRVNLVYPATTTLSFALLLFNPALLAALFASFNRETIMPAIRTPTRQMFFNVLPDRIKGRARAISVAIVMPLALFCCGMMIIYLNRFEGVEPIAAAGVVCALAYLGYAIRMGRDYITTLIGSMREKLYITQDADVVYTDTGPELISAMKQGLDSDDGDVSLSYARAIIRAYPEQAVGIIIERIRTLDVRTADQMVRMLDYESSKEHLGELDEIASGGDRHLRATVFEVMLAAGMDNRDQKIEQALYEDNPRLQVSAIYAAFIYAGPSLQYEALNVWRSLIDDGLSGQLASLRLLPLLNDPDLPSRKLLYDASMAMLPGLLDPADRQRCLSVMDALQMLDTSLPDDIRRMLSPWLEDDAPSLRTAATGLLRQITSGDDYEEALWRALADGHEKVRQAAVCVVMNSNPNYIYQFYEWLLENTRGTPRAHLTLLNEIMHDRASSMMLEQVAMVKARYAASVLCAIDTLQGSAGDEATWLLLTALRERLEQLNDLILLCIQPVLGMSSITVIRAGLNSRDERHVANAVEALDSLDNSMVEVIASLVKQDCATVLRRGFGREFAGHDEVVSWCTGLDDWWLKRCAENVIQRSRGEACA